MDVFRTPDERFEGLPGYDFEPHYAEVDGLRLHYVDEGPHQTGGSSASPAEPPRMKGRQIVCFHGEPTWAYLYRAMLGPLVEGETG
jgi:haloalkane dehalogenase